MKIGDKVRFLSEVGGGRVAGFQGKDIVLVEDADGFEVPMRKSDVVVIGEENYDTKHVVEMKQASQKPASSPTAEEDKETEPADRPITFRKAVEERKGGERLSAFIAFVPIDPKALSHTRFEAYFVNDSNYYMRYVYMCGENNSWTLRATDEVEPNTKVFIEEFGLEDVGQLDHICIQLTAYKREKHFLLKPTISVQQRIQSQKFYKLHTFQENDFFEQPALLYPIVENDRPARVTVVDL
ncbi:MAG: DUF2027 domain-containing protein [Prevotella sp.]|nr:DUF2027 domain-containing protein [Prevotella sp.]